MRDCILYSKKSWLKAGLQKFRLRQGWGKSIEEDELRFTFFDAELSLNNKNKVASRHVISELSKPGLHF